MNYRDRRDFLKLLGKSSMAVVLSSYLMPTKIYANATEDLGDFKALVVLQLMGGNDSFTMFVPTDKTDGSKTGYELYSDARSSLTRIKDNDMMSHLRTLRDAKGFLTLNAGAGNPYIPTGSDGLNLEEIYTHSMYIHDQHFEGKIGTHGAMPELANLLDLGKGAVIQNVGNIKQLSTKEELQSDRSLYPPFLGAHNQQENLTQTGVASTITHPTGWLGRLADRWNSESEVNSSIYGMNINLTRSGSNKMLYGENTSGFNYSYEGPKALLDVNETLYGNLLNTERRDLFKKLFKGSQKTVHDNLGYLLEDWANINGLGDPFASVTDSYGKTLSEIPLFDDYYLDSGADSKIIQSFTTAAKLISLAKDRGEKRVVINLSIGGFDTHNTQFRQHLKAYRGISIGLDKFTRAMDHLGISDKVTTFSISEFGRNLRTNGRGTAHGWGGSYFAVGDAVQPGNHGTFPDLTLAGKDDKRTSGTLIPTSSVTQYYATILKWFAANEATLKNVLPELVNFDEDTWDLGFMKTT